MSQDQNAVIQSGPPRRFLRKGEGLKRFAAYKPPLPTTAKKVERRQTFVRFKLDRNTSNVKKEPAHFMPPELLNDDSINLSTEIPKIAPPKIIHTPIRPNRNALGTLTNESSLFSDSQINGNIDNLFKKIEEKKSALPDKEENSFFGDETASFNDEPAPTINHKDEKKHAKKDAKKILKNFNQIPHPKESDECSSKRLDLPRDELHVAKPKRTTRALTSSPPVPEKSSSDSFLTEHIMKIESTVNELREKLKNCECCAPSSPQNAKRRPTTRAASRAAKSKVNDAKPTGPSANADKTTTKERLDSLANDFAQLKARLDEIQCGH